MLDIRLIERGLKKPGKTKGGLAAAMGVRPGAVSEILSGLRLIKAAEIADIIDAIRQLMAAPEKPAREIGFHVREKSPRYRTRAGR